MLAGLTPSPGEESDQSASVGPGGPTYSGRVVIPSCSSPPPPSVSDRSLCITETVYVSCHNMSAGNEQPNQSPTNSASTLHSLSFSTEEASTIENNEQSEDESVRTLSAEFITPTPSFRCKQRLSSSIEKDEFLEDESEATLSAVFITPTPSFRSKSRLSSTIENNERSEDESEDTLSAEFITPTPSFRSKQRLPSTIQNNERSGDESVDTFPAEFLTPSPSFRSKLRLSIEPITVQPTVVRFTDSETCACVGDIILEAPRGENPLVRSGGALENSVPLNENCHHPECGHSHSINVNSSNYSTAAVDHNEQLTVSETFCCDLFKIEITKEPHNHDNLDVARRPSAEPIKFEPSPNHESQVLQAADLSPLSSQSNSVGKQHKGSKAKLSNCFPF